MNLLKTKKSIALWSSVAILASLLAYFSFNYLAHHPSTDDAYVQADTINIAAQVTGPVADVFIHDHEAVAKDQALFTIDPAPFKIAVTKAEATLAAQEAALAFAIENSRRILRLVSSGQESKAAGDQAQAQLDTAKAMLAADQAELNRAQLDLAHTHVMAPRPGIVTQFLLRPGNNIIANNTLFLLVEQDHFWVDANFKETQLARIKPGQRVKIRLDMFPKKVFEGQVDAISPASGAQYALLPPENASGNWVKVTQRFPVKIAIRNPDPDYPLRVGATATATVDTTT